MVVDDEPWALKLLCDYVAKSPDLELVFETTHAQAALEKLQHGGVDLVFLDIQMPELSGIEFMKMNAANTKVVVTTAYAEYALEGYDFDVVDFLLKPITFERFRVAVTKSLLRSAQSLEGTVKPMESIFIKTTYKIQKLDFSSILYLEALRDYIAFHTTSGKILTLESMKNMEEMLPRHLFVRIHKSYIINKSKIELLDNGKVIINSIYLPIGKTYKKQFLSQLGM
jgi:DNA-binding LytR/AlgR family response regulator